MTFLRTRLTERLELKHPIISAPMAYAGGGALAAAVSAAGGLGLIGGGYGDKDWLEAQFKAAANQQVGCGFITWSLAKAPHLLSGVLAHAPKALMLSFGDPRPFAAEIAAAGSLLICQCQTLAHVEEALEAGAAIIVAQGAEGGGHGATRATFTLVPEAADYLKRKSPETLLVAAGGIVDGRGLAAALMLGADGVLMGSRFLASPEALLHDNLRETLLATSGDHTVRQIATDIARGFDWPESFTARVVQNAFTRNWVGREDEFRTVAAGQREAYFRAVAEGDADNVGVFVGEGVGLIKETLPAGEIVEKIAAEAAALLAGAGRQWLSAAP